MAGRPPLRIGQHGKITRKYLGGGVWLARARFRDSDGVTRIVERRGPADEQDAHGKLAEDALVDALNQRRAAGDSEITLDSRIIALVDQHIDRLEEDGSAVRTIDTYRYCAKLLGKIIAGVRVGEATPARLDAAIRSMRRAHGDVLAVQAKTILKGGLHLAVMANVLAANPVRDVSPMRAKSRPKGATASTADELRGLLTKLRESEACQRHDLADPHHPVYRDGSADLRAVGLALGRLRGRYGDADCHRKGHQSGGPGADADRRYEDGRRPKDSSVARFRRHCAVCSSWRAVFR